MCRMDSAANGTPKPLVLVTGGAGFIASHIVHQLHARGYRVRATVRSKANKERYKHIALPGVEIVEADLLTPGSFDDVVKGTNFLIISILLYRILIILVFPLPNLPILLIV